MVLTRVFCLHRVYVSLFEVDLLVLQGCTPGLCQDPSTSLRMTRVVKRFGGGMTLPYGVVGDLYTTSVTQDV